MTPVRANSAPWYGPCHGEGALELAQDSVGLAYGKLNDLIGAGLRVGVGVDPQLGRVAPRVGQVDSVAGPSFVGADEVLAEAPAQHFVGAFGDAGAADLPVPPFERQLFHQSQAAVDLDCAIDHTARHLGGHHFDHVG